MYNTSIPIKFNPVSQPPTLDLQGSTFLLFNPCDGYHLAEHAVFDDDVFAGFYTFGFSEFFDTDFYIAWAALPNAWDIDNALNGDKKSICSDCYDHISGGCSVCVKHKNSPGPRSQLMLDQMHNNFNLTDFLYRQREFSRETFGPHSRYKGIIRHIKKELKEITNEPTDLFEWIDVAILALDGAWRAGHEPEKICEALEAKLSKNKARNWPDWRVLPEDLAIEHDRTKDAK